MKTTIKKNSIFKKSLLFFILLSPVIPSFAASEETYVFERMWPTLKQPWYFSHIKFLDIDSKGYIYTSDMNLSRISKLSLDGHFVTEWGGGQSNIWDSHGITVDTNDYIYVVDKGNGRIHKFTSEGDFIILWGSYGSDKGEFSSPIGIANDQDNNIYVADRDNHRVQKFTSEGQFITMWGTYGIADGEFKHPAYLDTDSNGNVYVVEQGLPGTHRIQKFSSDGGFLAKWYYSGGDDAAEYGLGGIAVDQKDVVYVSGGYGLHKFTSGGNLIEKLEMPGGYGIAFDGKGHIYVPEFTNSHKYSVSGQLIASWGSRSNAEVDFTQIEHMASDTLGNIYVSTPQYIMKISSDDEVSTDYYIYDYIEGLFNAYFNAITVDKTGDIYATIEGSDVLTESREYGILKISPSGQSIRWGKYGSGDGEFNDPQGLAVDDDGNLYVADTVNNRIQKFTADGKFIASWGVHGDGNGEFNGLQDIALLSG